MSLILCRQPRNYSSSKKQRGVNFYDKRKRNKKRSYLLRIIYDEDLASPRTEDTNFGEMICFHKRHNLGDKHFYSDKDEFLYCLLTETLGGEELAERRMAEIASEIKQHDLKGVNYEKAFDVAMIEVIGEKNLIKPLYLYEHSGMTMNTFGFNDHFDSGLVGWIYTSHDEIKKELGDLSSASMEKAEQLLLNEVKTYDNYLQGNCFGYQLLQDGKEINSCYGFIGTFEEAKENIRFYLPEDAQKLLDQLKLGQTIEDTKEHPTKENTTTNKVRQEMEEDLEQ